MDNNPSVCSQRDLPAGTVTILFTDIQGSTELLLKLDQGYVNLISDHHRLMRESFKPYGGTEVRTQGDSFFVTFPRAPDAVSAAVDAQRAMAAHTWPDSVQVLVRMGIHTGQPWVAVEDYEGIDIHRAARIASTGHGGQVLLSETTTALVRDDLPKGVDLKNLGTHRLKDMRRPEQIYQLVIPGLPSDFPPIKSIEIIPTVTRWGSIRGYELQQSLGKGVFGEVYRAYQPTVRRDVAIKTILPEYANDPAFIRRFETEAQMVASLEHPHIVPLYDYWREPNGAYLVMRHLRGGSLEDALSFGPWKGEHAAHLVDQVASGLAYAHNQGIIHRDIKPANILLDEWGNTYLTDFGIATLAGSLQSQLEEGLAVPDKAYYSGSLGYMSPEVAAGGQASRLTDIYSFGVVLYQLVTGEHAFPGLSGDDLIQAHKTQPIPSVRLLRSELPPAVDQVIKKATAKDSDQRFQDAASLAAAFRAALFEETPAAPTIGVPLDVANPYKGLRAFQEADAAEFYGRSAMIERLVGRMQAKQGEAPRGRFLAVVGPSGSGKSSVVRAGLVPALRQGAVEGSDCWFILDMIPGAHPYEELEAALLRVAVNPPASLLEQLAADERGLVRAVKRCLPPDEEVELLLVVDQFEELFTLVQDPEETRRFLDCLYAAVMDPASRVQVVITLRADFYDRPLMHPDFSALVQEQTEVVVPLTTNELSEAVEQPARSVGARLEPGLTSRIVTDVHGEPGALPLLQYALTELFDHRDNGRLTQEAYQQIGGVLGALGKRAEDTYQGMDRTAQSAARQLFLRLVTLGEGTVDTRRRVLRSELKALGAAAESAGNPTAAEDWATAVDSVIGLFGGHRLLTFDRDPTTREPTVEVAHEALLGEWTRLRGWLDESRADVRMQRVLGNAAAEWTAADRDPSFLLRGARLEQFEGWSESSDLALTADERAFLDASLQDRRMRQAAEAERLAHEQALEKRSREARSEAELEREEARRQASIGLASQANLELRGLNPERSVPLALEALENYPYTWQAERALSQAVLESRLRLIIPGEAFYRHHDMSPDGSRLLSTRVDDMIIVHEFPGGEELLRLDAEGAMAAAWSPDGNKILIISDNGFQVLDDSGKVLQQGPADPQCAEFRWHPWAPESDRFVLADEGGPARVIDAQTGETLLVLDGHQEDTLSGAAWSPLGNYILTSGLDNQAILWEAESGRKIANFPQDTEFGVGLLGWSPSEQYFALVGGELHVYETRTRRELFSRPGGVTYYKAAWSPDEEIVVVTSVVGGDARAFDASTGEKIASITNLIQGFDVSWSPSGDVVAVGGYGIRIWDPRSDREIHRLYPINGDLKSIYWSPNGDYIVATGESTSDITLFDLTTAEFTIQGPPGVATASWSTDGTQIGRLYQDGTVIIYDAQTGEQLFELDSGIKWGPAPVWSPSGDRILTVNIDGQVKIWDADTGELLLKLPEDAHIFPFSGDWSPDGERIVTIDGFGRPAIWDSQSGEQYLVYEGHSEEGYGIVAWSPDGTRIASTSGSHTGVGRAMIWDADTGEIILDLFEEGKIESDFGAGVAWSHDGTKIAVFAGKVGHVFNSQTGEELARMLSHDSAWVITWSPSDERILSVGTDGYGRVWDASTGNELISYYVGFFPNGEYSPDGSKVLLATGDGTTRIFPTWHSYQELMAFARECYLVRELTPAERELFGLPVDESQ